MKLKYDNITISGGVGVGTSTLANNLKPFLEPLAFQFKSNGEFVREYTHENVLPLATLVTEEMDREIDGRVINTLKTEKNWVLEGWLSGFFAREFDHVFRILLICSNTSLRVDRVTNRDKVTTEEAKHNIKVREEENFKKWQKEYGNYNFFAPEYYHLVVDTYSSGQMETVGKVLDEIGYNTKHHLKK